MKNLKEIEMAELNKSEARRERTEKMMKNVPPIKMRKKRFQELRNHLDILRVNNLEKYRKLMKGTK